MIPSSTSDEVNGNGGGGMSRAAKKRAKKKKKQSLAQAIPEGKRHVPGNNDNNKANSSAGNNDTKISSSKKRKQLDEPSSPSRNLTKNDIAPRASFPPDLSLSEILFIQDCKDKATSQKLKRMTTTQRAACLFQAILEPITLKEFYKVYFEKKPLVISSESVKNKSRYSNLLSLESIKAMTKKHEMYFGRDLNVTDYKKGSDGVKRRITLDNTVDDNDEEGSNGVRVDRSELWSNYEKGCTIRLLCPHKYSDVIQSLLSTLEVEFQCMVGANAYLTPARSSQGFAPHYDDIDAFCLQLEGSKRWKVYEPTMKLPRTSSEDFTPEDLESMKLVLDVTLNEGDLLYMPRVS